MAAEAALASHLLSTERIRERLMPRAVVGRKICLFDDVPSTNAVLRGMADAGAREGTVVLAEGQSAGRGRDGKPWYSPPGVNLYASVLFRPALPSGAVGAFSFVASLAVADTVEAIGLEAAIKWPNDVLVHGKKVAGVLVEVASVEDRVAHVILGIGVNLNVSAEALAAALGGAADGATSLREALGREVDRNAFAAAFLNFLGRWLGVSEEWGEQALIRSWRERDVLTGRWVQVRTGAAVLEGRALGVDGRGFLEVESARGDVHRIVEGEVRVVG